MGLAQKGRVALTNAEPEQEQAKVTLRSNDLNKDELELLLRLLREADVKGHQVEFFYSMVVKLQNQYLSK